MTKKILITGKNSFIGSSFMKYCSKNNIDFDIEEMSVRGEEWKNEDLSEYDTVFHVAGIAHANPSENQADFYYKVNSDLAIEVAQHAKEAGVKQFIFMSSAIVYTSSELDNGKITKNTIPKSDDFYGDSKIQAEKGLNLLNNEKLKIVILRPPMIYGKGSKGNYSRLSKLARTTPVFPNYNNKRSMLHIDNLTELIRLIIVNEDEGIFFPQNPDYVKTSDLVKTIAAHYNHKVWLTKLANPIIPLLNHITLFNKVFGNLYYDRNMSIYDKGNYQIRDLKKSVKLTENSK